MFDKKTLFLSIVPHVICAGILLLLSFIYFYPVLNGKEIKQQDIVNSRATSKEIREYRAETGEEALWTNSQFSGMPAFNINTYYSGNFIKNFGYLFTLYLPSNMGLLFTLLIGFYILLCTLKIDPWLALLGAIAFGFSSYFMILFPAGHNSKLRSIGYMAPVLASLFYTLRNRTYLGGAFMAVTLSLCIAANHVQITYYLAIIVGVIMISEYIYAFKEKTLKPLIKKSAVLVVAALLALGPNVSALWSTYAYGKETIRGGQSGLTVTKEATDGGLDMEYAMRWSYGPMETFTLLIPGLYGGASTGKLSKKSETYSQLLDRGIEPGRAKNIIKQLPLYHGDQPFTSGPVYFGAIICFLFVFGLFVMNNKMRIWVISIVLISILLSWGRHLMFLSEFMFNYLPFYNKFRAPSTILVMSSVLFPLVAMYGLNKFINAGSMQKSMFEKLKKAGYITAGFCLLFGLMGGLFFDFSGVSDVQLGQQGWPIEAIEDDRESILKLSAFKSLALIALSFLLILFYYKNKIGKVLFITGLGVLFVFDFGLEGKKYFNADNFVKKRNVFAAHQPNAIDLQIMEDPDPYYRVFNITGNPTNDPITSSNHKSLTGYHGAKLLRYQEILERYLVYGGGIKPNENVYSMLNAKYIIEADDQRRINARINPKALGNAWFVDNIKWVANADEEINSLASFNPGNTAIIDERYKDYVPFDASQGNGALSNIQLEDYRPNRLTYKANVLGDESLAVFSEIYYEGGNNDWKVFIDGIETSHIRVNYVLRALAIPKGEHTIEFKFLPSSYFTGEKISLTSSFLLIILLLGAIGWEIKTVKPEETESPTPQSD